MTSYNLGLESCLAQKRSSLQTLQPQQWESGALPRTGRRLRRNATKKKNKHFPCIVTGTADRRRFAESSKGAYRSDAKRRNRAERRILPLVGGERT